MSRAAAWFAAQSFCGRETPKPVAPHAGRPSRERLGKPELIDFQLASGAIVKKLMTPVLDENGGWVRWIDGVAR